MIDCCYFAEHLTRLEIAERDGFAIRRIDADANFAIGNEKDLIRLIEIVEDERTRLIILPIAALLSALDRVRREATKQRYPFKERDG